MKKISTLLFLLSLTFTGNAQDLFGGEITWRTDSLQHFIFQVKLYVDCSGPTAPNTITLATNADSLGAGINCNKISTTDISSTGVGTCPSCNMPLLIPG